MKEALAQVKPTCITGHWSSRILACVSLVCLRIAFINTLSYQFRFQVEVNFPDSIAYKLNLYRGYIAICHPDEQHLNMVGLTKGLFSPVV